MTLPRNTDEKGRVRARDLRPGDQLAAGRVVEAVGPIIRERGTNRLVVNVAVRNPTGSRYVSAWRADTRIRLPQPPPPDPED